MVEGGVVEGVAGTTVLLDCPYVSHPPAMVSWDRDGQRVTDSLVLPNNSLLLENVGGANSSNYSCTVRNSFGPDGILYQLTVLGGKHTPTCWCHGDDMLFFQKSQCNQES